MTAGLGGMGSVVEAGVLAAARAMEEKVDEELEKLDKVSLVLSGR